MVALLSAAYFDRDRYTSDEWTAAMLHVPGTGQGRLVPVRVEEAPPALVLPVEDEQPPSGEKTRVMARSARALTAPAAAADSAALLAKIGARSIVAEGVGSMIPGCCQVLGRKLKRASNGPQRFW